VGTGALVPFDDEIRAAAFAYVGQVTARNGGIITREELEAFTFRNSRLPLVERQKGIRKPADLDAALSILTTYTADPTQAPYSDEVGDDGFLRYKWRGTDGDHAENRALRLALQQGKPLLYLYGVGPGRFIPQQVWLVDEEPGSHQFVVSLDEDLVAQWRDVTHPVDLIARRRYAEHVVRTRLHQRVFRERVLTAYEHRCALCSLRHPELLDAAHIKEDSDGGEPTVTNGVSMCAIHHRAFDGLVLGIRPDYVVEVRADVMAETDGPTLRHSLQGMNDVQLQLPHQRAARPDPLLLEERYERFRAAS
jgi:putative restriction endonuclease